MINLRNLLYASLFSSFLIFQQSSVKAERVYYPREQSDDKTAEIKDHYNSLEKIILDNAEALKDPIEGVISGRTKGYPILLSTTETNEDPTKKYDEKEGTFLVVVTLPQKEFGIKVRYHPRDNESNILVVKFKRTKEFESATFLRKNNGKEKEQREIINKGRGIYEIIDSAFENDIQKTVLGRVVGKLTDNFDVQPYTALYEEYFSNYISEINNKKVKQ